MLRISEVLGRLLELTDNICVIIFFRLHEYLLGNGSKIPLSILLPSYNMLVPLNGFFNAVN
jgi:hypothetical protein